MGALFRRTALAFAVPPVIEDKYVDASPVMGQSQFADAVTVVPAVPVKPEPRDVCTGFSGDEPALQDQAVGGLDADVFVIQIDVVGRVQQLCHREEYEPLF